MIKNSKSKTEINNEEDALSNCKGKTVLDQPKRSLSVLNQKSQYPRGAHALSSPHTPRFLTK